MKTLKGVKRSKETISDETDPFSIIPLELKTEIFMKLRARDIAKLIFVSKHLSSTVHGKDFIDFFLSQSSTRPQFLFVFKSLLKGRADELIIQSSSQEDPLLDYQRVRITSTPMNDDFGFTVSPPVNGLICCQSGTKVLICNPGTGQFLTLPRIKTWRKYISTYFGYDPINDQYKVLCMTFLCTTKEQKRRHYKGEYYEHQVFTLGAGKTWRMIKCKLPHSPSFGGICKNGVVYYIAWNNSKRCIISFDLGSEDFRVIELPVELPDSCHRTILPYLDLVNYNGKIALVFKIARNPFSGSSTPSRLWILEDPSKQEWLYVPGLFSSLKTLLNSKKKLEFRGAISTGELIFARGTDKYFRIYYYDCKKNKYRRVVIKGPGDDFSYMEVFLGHTESPMILSKKLLRGDA